MRTYQLRTYRLRTEGAAAIYWPHWIAHAKSLKLFGLVPRNVVALISFCEHTDSGVVTQDVHSDAFKADMAEFDITQIEGLATLLRNPREGWSPDMTLSPERSGCLTMLETGPPVNSEISVCPKSRKGVIYALS